MASNHLSDIITGAMCCFSFITLDSAYFHKLKPEWKPFKYVTYGAGAVTTILIVLHFTV